MVVEGTLNILAKSALVFVLASWRNTVIWSELESYVVTLVLMMEVMLPPSHKAREILLVILSFPSVQCLARKFALVLKLCSSSLSFASLRLGC